MDKPEKVKRECRCSSEFRLQLIDLAYYAGFLKKQKFQNPADDSEMIDVVELDDVSRGVYLDRVQGVSQFISSIIKKKDIIIDSSDKTDMKEIEKSFNRTGSNISQLATLSQGVTFKVKDKPYDLEKAFHDFIRVKSLLGEQINQLLEMKTTTEITSGKILDAKNNFAHGRDEEGTFSDRMYFSFESDINDILLASSMKLKPKFRELVREAKLQKLGAPINHPLILIALEIYQKLNSDLQEVNTLRLEGKNYYGHVFVSLRDRKKECLSLLEEVTNENIRLRTKT